MDEGTALLDERSRTRQQDMAEAQFGPRRPTVVEAVRRRPLLIVLPVLVLLIGAAAYGLNRTPVYTAEARLSVGRIDLSQPGALNGFAAATPLLATVYSRAVSAAAVIQQVSRDTGVTPLNVRRRLDSTPIPDTSLFTISATGDDRDAAIRMANSASEALKDFVRTTNTSPDDNAPTLLRAYRDEQVNVVEASQTSASARERLARSDTAANRAAVAQAAGDLAAAQLRAKSAAAAYSTSVAGTSINPSVTILAPASFAVSDRSSKFQIYCFAALVAGLVLGIALATLVEDRRFARDRRARGEPS
jgi:capsular polysaccharide biosynthesis protein